jgi:hypothetical protein
LAVSCLSGFLACLPACFSLFGRALLQVCLFSYGQTGSGKTHSMVGSREGPAQGIIPRAVDQILTLATQVNRELLDASRQGSSGGGSGSKTVYAMQAGFLEIYNEQLRDLLGELRDSAGGDATQPRLAIKQERTSGGDKGGKGTGGQLETKVSVQRGSSEK